MSDDIGVTVVSHEEFDRLLDMLDKPPEVTPAMRAMVADWRERWPRRKGKLVLEDGTEHQVEEDLGTWRIIK